MTSAQVVEMSVTNNSSFQNYSHYMHTIWTSLISFKKIFPQIWGAKFRVRPFCECGLSMKLYGTCPASIYMHFFLTLISYQAQDSVKGKGLKYMMHAYKEKQKHFQH